MDRQKQWSYAISLLQGFGINVDDDRMSFTGNGRYLIIHSKQLCNCIQIKKQDTEDDIFKRIQREIKIKLRRCDNVDNRVGDWRTAKYIVKSIKREWGYVTCNRGTEKSQNKVLQWES